MHNNKTRYVQQLPNAAVLSVLDRPQRATVLLSLARALKANGRVGQITLALAKEVAHGDRDGAPHRGKYLNRYEPDFDGS